VRRDRERPVRGGPRGDRARLRPGVRRADGPATFNLPNAAALTAPPTRLADNPTFARARAALPAGAGVPFFLDFGPIASLAQAASSASGRRVEAVLRRLDYLAIGSTGRPIHVRIVLGLH
jgi:hypothetical protein